MKIAACFCGHVRTGEYSADNLIRYIGDLLPDVDFFMHTWNENYYKGVSPRSVHIEKLCQEKNCTVRELDKKYLHPYTPPDTFSVIEKMQKKYNKNFKKIEIELFDHAELKKKMYAKFTPHWYAWYKTIQLKRNYEEENNFKYDYVIKLRPDLMFPKNENLQKEIEHCASNDIENSFFVKDDVFYVANSDIMDRASTMIMNNNIDKLGRDTYFDNLKLVNIQVKRTSTQKYSIYRPENIPESSLNFIDCFNVAHEWYSASTIKSPYEGLTDL